MSGLAILPEQTMWADRVWADYVWADRFWASAIDVSNRLLDGTEARGDPFEAILEVVSTGSFPATGSRKNLSPGQGRQLRDAMHLALHVQYNRDLFVTSDNRAFIADGRRAVLDKMLDTRIRTPAEAIAMLSNGPSGSEPGPP